MNDLVRQLINVTSDGTVPRVNIYGGPLGVTFFLNLGIATLLFLIFLIILERFTFYNSFKKKMLYLSVLHQINPQSDIEKPNTKPNLRQQIRHYLEHRFEFYKQILLCLLSKETRELELQRIVRVYGRDVATYFLFLQLNLAAVAGITLCSLFILLPVHLRFSLSDPEYVTQYVGDTVWTDVPILYTSLPSTHNEPWILCFHLVYACAVILICIYCAMKFLMHPLVNQYNYCNCDEELEPNGLMIKNGRANIVELARKENQTMQHYSDYNSSMAALFSSQVVEIRGLPSNFTSEKLFHLLVSRLVKDSSQIVKASLLMDYSPYLHYRSKMQRFQNELERFEMYYEKTGQRSALEIINLETNQLEQVDAISHLQKRVEENQFLMMQTMTQITQCRQMDYVLEQLEDQRILLATQTIPPFLQTISEKKKKKRIQGSGFGFVVFRDSWSANEFLKSVSLYGLLVRFFQKEENLLVRMIANPWEQRKRSLFARHLLYKPNQLFANRRLLRVNRMEFEPHDLNWNRLFSYYKIGFIIPLFTRIVVGVLAVIAIAVFCVSLTIASGFQLLINTVLLSDKSPESSQVFGAFLFNYLPTFFLFLCVLILPFAIERATIQFAHYKSFSKPRRLILQLIYGGLLLNVLILPTLGLIAMNGIGDYFNNTRLNETVSRIYYPTSGAFFISLLLQFAFLKNIGDLLRPIDLLEYIVTYIRLKLQKGMITLKESLKLAELSDFRLEKEYGFILSVKAIALCYSVFSPIAALCGLLYFLFKYVVDCYSLLYMYSHYGHLHRMGEKEVILHYGSVLGFKTNFISHHHYCKLLFRSFMINMIVFTIFLIAYFGSRISLNDQFVFHTLLSIVLCAFCLVFVIVAERLFDYQFRGVVSEVTAATQQAKSSSVNWSKLYEFPHLQQVSPIATNATMSMA